MAGIPGIFDSVFWPGRVLHKGVNLVFRVACNDTVKEEEILVVHRDDQVPVIVFCELDLVGSVLSDGDALMSKRNFHGRIDRWDFRVLPWTLLQNRSESRRTSQRRRRISASHVPH